MSSHVELNPDDSTLGLSLGMKAMRLALTQKTHKMGTVRIPGTGGTDVIIGAGASDGVNRVDKDGVQLPLVDTSGIDKAAQDARKAAADAAAKADEAVRRGEQIRQDVQAGIDDARKQVQAVEAKADKVRTDLTQQVQNVKSEMDLAVEDAQTSANKAQSAADAAQKAADKANASTVDLDKSVQAVDAKAIAAKQAAAEAQSKAENVASDLDSANAVIEQHTIELGELTTKVSNAVKKSDSALNVSTEAKQTATEASTTATSAYKDSQTALTQSTTATQTATTAKTTAESASKTASDSLKQSSAAVQTANQISTTLKTEYQTKADADKIYATQSSLKQTSDSITASVSKTYATKDALSALQNVADNAIESWRGTGVPTLTNKPASDWTTNADKKKHSGDLYYDKSTGKAYRFGSDGVTYTWELNQDTDVTKALADASKAQQTADAVTLNLSKNYQTKAQNDAVYATQTSLKATSDSLSANITANARTAQSAVDKATSLEANLNGFKTTVAETYQTKSGMSAYATNSSLTQTANSIKAQVTEVSKTANGAMSKATTVEQTANGLSSKITEQGKTLNATVKTANEAKSTADSNKTTISQVSTTASNALSKASTVEQNLNGFKTSVSQTYGRGSNLWVNPTFDADKPQITSRVNNVTAPNGSGVNLLAGRDHYNSATSFPVVPGHTYVVTAHVKRLEGDLPLTAGIWYTAQTGGTCWDSITSCESTSSLSDGWMAATWRFTCPDGKSRGCVVFHLEQWKSSTQWYVANVVCVDVTGLQPSGDYATNSSLSQTANSITAQVSEVAKTASGAMNKASSVEQTASGLSTKIAEQAKTLDATVKTANEAKSTADSNKRTISQVASTADGAVSRVSSLEQNLNGFKTSVAKTYQTKGDYPTKAEVQSRIDQSASSIKSTVGQTYTTLDATEALRKSATRMFTLYGAPGSPKWVKLGYLTSNGDSSSVLLHVYSGDGYNGAARQNAEFEIFVKDGWQSSASASFAFGVSVNRIRNADDVKVKVMAFSATACDIWAYLPWDWWNGHYALQGDYKAWQDGPNCVGERILDSEPTNGVAQDLAYDTLSTRSYVDQTSKSVALGVMQNYRGTDGSGLATKSDITVAKNSITSTVAGTYATKSGVTQEISSKITQNNNSLDVKFATKTETKTAQATANTAKSDASDAQSRVGTLEDCIRLTSEGVRAGHQKNGVFNGVSALVNTDGSFDLLGKDGNLLTRIDRHSLQVAGDDGTGSGYLVLSQDGLDITVHPTANKTVTYHIRLGAGGISITAPDGTHVECSARTGLDLETVRYGKLSIGPGGLQFTNDQGWGLSLSAAGWSLKWAGNHMLATGPTAGKLYIDGHEIVTK